MEKTVIVKVNLEYEKLLPKLSQEDFEELKTSIRNDGLHYAIVINKEGVVLDGHHRYMACEEIGIEPKFEIKEFPNALLEKKFVIESNLRRRHLTEFQRYELAMSLLEIESQLAKERQLKGTLVPIGTKGRAVDIVAYEQNLKPMTFFRVKKILELAPERLKEQVRRGEKTIFAAYNEVRSYEEYKKVIEFDGFRPTTPYGENMYRISTKFQASRKDGYFVIKEDEALPTLKRRSWFFHEDGREYSLREYARVQEFPDSFAFVGSLEQIKDQIGNAVPPLMAHHVAKKFPPSTSIDLFAGAGGMSLGFQQVGHKILLMVEWDRACCYTYHHNFPHVKILQKDIRQLGIEEITQKLDGQDINLIFAGPPCQGFSVSGLRFKDDPRNELYREFLKIVDGLKPKFLVMENVLGILDFKQQILEDIEGIGYSAFLDVIKGEDLGMRQHRHRVFFYGTRKE